MEIGLAIAGILPLAQELHKMGRRYYKSFRRAPAEARRFGNLVEDVSDTLSMFCKTANEVKEKQIPLARDKKATRAVRRLKKMMKASIEEIRSTFQRLKVIGNPEYPWRDRAMARIRWVTGDEKETKSLIANLNTAKLDISLLLNIFSVNIQLKIVRDLEARNEPMPEYLIQELTLLKKRHKILKRRYKEAVKEREVLVAARATHSINNRSDFVALSQSFGQQVHDFAQEQMPAAQVILDEIVRDYALPFSPTETTTNGPSSADIPLRPEVGPMSESEGEDTAPASVLTEDPGEKLGEYDSGSTSNLSFLSTRGVVGETKWPEWRHVLKRAVRSIDEEGNVLEDPAAELVEGDIHQDSSNHSCPACSGLGNIERGKYPQSPRDIDRTVTTDELEVTRPVREDHDHAGDNPQL